MDANFGFGKVTNGSKINVYTFTSVYLQLQMSLILQLHPFNVCPKPI